MAGTTPHNSGRAGALPPAASAIRPAEGATNLADVLERVLDKGIVIAGDIRVNLLDIELLTIKLRLVVASVDTARRMGIDWWETDAWLSGREAEDERRSLHDRVMRIERQLESGGDRSPDAESEDLRREVARLRRQLERRSGSREAAG